MATIGQWMRVFGVEPRRAVAAMRGLARFAGECREFRRRMGKDFRWGAVTPCLGESEAASGSLGAYFQQDLLVAWWIHEARPARHVDIGSRIDGFVGHLAVFREVEVLDIRPQTESARNIRFRQVDVMTETGPEWQACTDSLSCLHTIEHFGLGRYGDRLDPDGHLVGLAAMKRMVVPGGMFYLSTPMGPQRVEFNAHRVFSAATILGWFGDGWSVEKFAVVDDAGRCHEEPERTPAAIAGNFGCELGVGIVAARKWRLED